MHFWLTGLCDALEIHTPGDGPIGNFSSNLKLLRPLIQNAFEFFDPTGVCALNRRSVAMLHEPLRAVLGCALNEVVRGFGASSTVLFRTVAARANCRTDMMGQCLHRVRLLQKTGHAGIAKPA